MSWFLFGMIFGVISIVGSRFISEEMRREDSNNLNYQEEQNDNEV